MPSPVGELTLVADDTALRTISWNTDEHSSPELDAGVSSDVVDVAAADHSVLARAARQLGEYFDGSRTEFDVPLAPDGDAVPAAGVEGADVDPVRRDDQLRRAGAPSSVIDGGACRGRGERAQPDPDHRAVPPRRRFERPPDRLRRRHRVEGLAARSRAPRQLRRVDLVFAELAGHMAKWPATSIEESVPSVYILPDQRLVECGTAEAVLRRRSAPASPSPTRAGSRFVFDVPRRRGGGMGRVRERSAEGAGDRRASRLRSGVPPGLPDENRGGRHDAAPGARRRATSSSPTSVPDPARRPADRPAGRSAVARRARPRPIGKEVQRGRPVRRHPRLHGVRRGAAAVRRAPRAAAPSPRRDRRRRAPRWRRHQLHGRRRHGPVRSRARRIVQPPRGAGRPGDAGGDRSRRRRSWRSCTGDRSTSTSGSTTARPSSASVWGGPASVTAIGDTVNLASRIEQANKVHGTRFLMSEATLGELGRRRDRRADVLVLAPGKAGEHTLIEVLGTRH